MMEESVSQNQDFGDAAEMVYSLIQTGTTHQEGTLQDRTNTPT